MNRNVPKLRFKGFEGEWIEKKLGELGDFFKGNGLSKADLSEEGEECILYGELYTTYGEVISSIKSRTNSKLKNKVLSKKNDIIIPSSGETAIDIATASCVMKNDVILGGDLNVFRAECDNGVLLSYQLNNSKRKEIAKIAQGASVVHIYNEQLKKVKVKIPSLQEQEKIANFLTKVDSLIEEQDGKVSDLEQYKKGMMQKIFSQEIRFKDENGCDYPEWEEKKLSQVTISLDNMRKPLNSSERLEMKGDIPYYGANGIVDYVNSYIFDERLILLAEDGGNFDEFATRPIAQLIDGKSWVNNHAHVLKADKSYIDYIFYSLVHKDIRKYINGTSRAKLNKSDMLDIRLNIPCLEEQIKIAKFLSNIDSIIEKEKNKLEDLRQWKKGLLQQMFV